MSRLTLLADGGRARRLDGTYGSREHVTLIRSDRFGQGVVQNKQVRSVAFARRPSAFAMCKLRFVTYTLHLREETKIDGPIRLSPRNGGPNQSLALLGRVGLMGGRHAHTPNLISINATRDEIKKAERATLARRRQGLYGERTDGSLVWSPIARSTSRHAL